VIKRPAVGGLFEIVETLVLTVAIFFGIQTFVAQPFSVEGPSMETTLETGEYLLIDKLTPHWAAYARGDVVVLEPPAAYAGSRGVPFIKRVIGLPGDRVQLKDGKVYVNGAELDEPYVYRDAGGGSQATDPMPGGPSEWVVPADDLLVMGDHRQQSADSRAFGPIAISTVVGRAWLRYWPFDTFGTLSAPRYAAAGAGSP
jgi:signal peptidase I